MQNGQLSDKSYIEFSHSLYDEDITLEEQSLLLSIVSFYDKKKGYAYPTYKKLKFRSKIKQNAILTKTIDSLIKKGYIEKGTVTCTSRIKCMINLKYSDLFLVLE